MTDGSALPLLPTPTAADGRRGPDYAKAARPGAGGDDLITAVARLFPREKGEKLLKTPTANLSRNGAPQHPVKRKQGGHGPTLEDEVCFLLSVEPNDRRWNPRRAHSPSEWWNEFAPAVGRWELLMGSPAPVPVEYGPRGGLRLAPPFAEWMMGLPSGHVTEVEGLSRGDQLKAIGDGAVPQQARAAYGYLLGFLEGEYERGDSLAA
ncbi:DNA (cytosine-5-)-methyltransferase [Streptomyces sioyaensis]|uniref:DNA (cytosine-5-)-methyltransferase n=1 Tax=Streptomyces TaxID=1883 RepID=UPI0036EA3AD9